MVAMENNKPRRFAILCRVSTPGQEKKETPIENQIRNCERSVQWLDGKVTHRYVGQEHATPENLRVLFDQMLADAEAGKFDALVIDEPSRFARDNLRAEQAMAVLKKRQIPIYVGTNRFDLHNPMQKFILSSGFNVAEMYGSSMSLKSVDGKISAAKKGVPSTGAVPWGRSYNRETNRWEVDEEKKKKLQDAAEAFMNGATIRDLAPMVGISSGTLMSLFRGAAGDTFTVRFNPKQHPELAETVVIPIPELLGKDMLRALSKRFNRGPGFFGEQRQRHAQDYLLRGMVFCGTCGYGLSPLTVGKHKYYFHTNTAAGKPLDRCFANLPATTIEDAAMREIFELVGDVKRRKAAIENAYKGISQAIAVREKIDKARADLKRVFSQKELLVEKVMNGVLSDDNIKKAMAKLESQEQAHRSAIAELEAAVAEVPTKEEIQKVAEAIARHKPGRPTREVMEEGLEHSRLGSKGHLKEMTFAEKRDLLKLIFGYAEKTGGKMRKGVKTTKFVKAGVYVKRTPTGTWSYLIKGMMLGGDIRGDVPPVIGSKPSF